MFRKITITIHKNNKFTGKTFLSLYSEIAKSLYRLNLTKDLSVFSFFFDFFEMLLILDIDGIFTDGKHHYSKDGKIMKTFGSNDRYVLNLLKTTNLFEEIFCLTGDGTGIGIDISKARVEKELGIPVVSTKEKGVKSKYDYVLNHYGDKIFIKENVVYIGDDLADLKIIRDSNWSATTKNAPTLVKKYCNYISEYGGGEGGLADILLEYMKIKGINMESLFFN